MFNKHHYNIEIETAKNGLRIATDRMPDVESAVFIVAVKTGSINETDKNNGVSHFLEHMAFKGTTTRTAKEIAQQIENVGGQMNAFTSKEETVYYVKVLKEDMNLAIDILSDIMQNSVFDEAEIERERNVILQELSSTLDSPDEVVFNNFFSKAYQGTPLARTIIGSKENIIQLNRKSFIDYIDDYYFTKNMTVVCCGDIDHKEFFNLAEEKFSNLRTKSALKDTTAKKMLYHGGEIIQSKDQLEQLQFVLGFESCPYTQEEKFYKTHILSGILGGGSSSRMFQEIREKRGLAYSVDVFCDPHHDVGTLIVQADSSVNNLDNLIKGIKLVLKESMKKIDEDEVTKIKNQYRASVLMSRESTTVRARKLANDVLLFNKYISPEEIWDDIKDFNGKKASKLLSDILMQTSNPTLSIYADFKNTFVPNNLINEYKF